MKKKSSYNKKFYNSIFGKIYVYITNRIVDLYDYYWDMRICKKSLIKYIPSVDDKKYTGTQSTRYWVLEHIFQNAKLNDSDSFVEIGCGKGRVVAFLIKSNFKCKITGVELNPEVAAYCKSWTSEYSNVEIINDNALNLNYNDYSSMFMGRPFLPELFEEFVNKIETELNHSITLYYWVDQQSGNYLNDREGWKLVKRRWLFRKHKLCIARFPQRYSIWEYTPK